MANEPEHLSKPIFSDTTYQRVKLTNQIVLPALGTLYFTLAQIWGLPAAEQIVGTLAALAIFLGVLLSISSRAYNSSDARFDGTLAVNHVNDDTKMFSLELNAQPEELEGKDSVTFKVKTQ